MAARGAVRAQGGRGAAAARGGAGTTGEAGAGDAGDAGDTGTAAPRTTDADTADADALDPDRWTDSELDEVRAELARQAGELRGELDEAASAAAAVQQSGLGEGPGDEADAGTATFEREHEVSLANNSRDLLTQVERALARLADRTYGRCEGCSGQIPKPRLQAFPRATLCVRCKQREERR